MVQRPLITEQSPHLPPFLPVQLCEGRTNLLLCPLALTQTSVWSKEGQSCLGHVVLPPTPCCVAPPPSRWARDAGRFHLNTTPTPTADRAGRVPATACPPGGSPGRPSVPRSPDSGQSRLGEQGPTT